MYTNRAVAEYWCGNIFHLYRLGSGSTATVSIGIGNRNVLVADRSPLCNHRITTARIATIGAYRPCIIGHVFIGSQCQGIVAFGSADTYILVVQSRSRYIINHDGLRGMRLAARGIMGSHHGDGLLTCGGPHGGNLVR